MIQPTTSQDDKFKSKYDRYNLPLAAENFMTTAKRIAHDHRKQNPLPCDKNLTEFKFMVRTFEKTDKGYKAVICSATLDPMVYVVTWDDDVLSYSLDVYQKLDHCKFTV